MGNQTAGRRGPARKLDRAAQLHVTLPGVPAYSDTSTCMDPEQLLVVSNSSVTASTQAP